MIQGKYDMKMQADGLFVGGSWSKRTSSLNTTITMTMISLQTRRSKVEKWCILDELEEGRTYNICLLYTSPSPRD